MIDFQDVGYPAVRCVQLSPELTAGRVESHLLLSFRFAGQRSEEFHVPVPGVVKIEAGQQDFSNQPRRLRSPDETSETAPPKCGDRGRLDNAGANRVEVHVMDNPLKRARVLHQQRPIPALEKMSVHGSMAIEARGKRTLEPVHPFHQVRSWRFQREMIVVAHDDVGVKSPIMPDTRFRQRGFERLGGARGFEYVTAVITAVDDVIQRAGILNA